MTATLPERAWNPRYLAYCKAHGHEGDPAGMIAADKVTYPGGHMAGFLVWGSVKLGEWCALKGYRRTASGHSDTLLRDVDFVEYEAWLQEQSA